MFGLPWLEAVESYAVPLRTRFRGITVRHGLLLKGPLGWGEFCPFEEYPDEVAAAWLATAVEACTVGFPTPLRSSVPVNVTVPAVGAQAAFDLVRASGCTTAKVKVADHPASLPEDLERVEAVRSALGPAGRIRVDANARWDADRAVTSLRALERAAGGLEYAEQPCPSVEELAIVRRRLPSVPIAADESIRQALDPRRVALSDAADVAVIKCTPLGGVRRSLEVAESVGLPCVVSSALETSVGMSSQLALAGVLPSLPFACGLGTLSLFDGDVVPPASSLVARAGVVPVPSRVPDPVSPPAPGFPVMDGARARWWTERLSRAAALLPRVR